MIRVFVVDRTAESRSQIIRSLQSILSSDAPEFDLLPRISVQPLSVEELKFHSGADLIIIGTEIVRGEFIAISGIRKTLPETPMMALLPNGPLDYALVEQLARIGIDDTLEESPRAEEFLKRVILLARKASSKKSGKLIVVDSSKGGVGKTTATAALAERLLEEGRKVLVIDFDLTTQNLTRFLQIRPAVNENLQLLLDRSRPITQEFIEQALYQVWEGDELYCMPPVPNQEMFYDSQSGVCRHMHSVLEVLDSTFDYVVIDTARIEGQMLKMLYRVADEVLFFVSSDPAAVFSGVERVLLMKKQMSPAATLRIIENGAPVAGLPTRTLKEEFLFAANLEEVHWCSVSIPFCRLAHRWPASGSTLYSLGKQPVKKAVSGIVQFVTGKEPARALDETRSERGTLIEKVRNAVLQLKLKKGAAPNSVKKAVSVEPLNLLHSGRVPESRRLSVIEGEMQTIGSSEMKEELSIEKMVSGIQFS